MQQPQGGDRRRVLLVCLVLLTVGGVLWIYFVVVVRVCLFVLVKCMCFGE